MYITVGRNPQSNIVIRDCNVVSYDHATIEYENGQFLFIDDSSNGTIINGYRINHASRPIAPGDNIMLAGVFHLDWNLIVSKVPNFMPPSNDYDRPTVSHISKETELMNSGSYNSDGRNVTRADNNPVDLVDSEASHENMQLDKWNWGAFLLGWIWGVFNNVYWTLIALIPIPLCALIVNIIVGIKGTRQAWENGNWKVADYQRFKKKQHQWAVAGFIVLGICILLTIIYSAVVVSFLSNLLSN